MKRLSLFLCLSFLLNVSLAQLENANWCFGDAAMVNFNTTIPQTGTSGLNSQFTDVASVSDQNGQLQFYTDGENVWGKNHQIMPNGTHLYGLGSGGTNVQILAIAPKPGSTNLYYLFTESYGFFSTPLSVRAGVYYSIIDMSLNNGNGDVVANKKNIPLRDHNGIMIDYPHSSSPFKYARMTTTLHFDGDKIWLVLLPVFYNGSGDVASRFIYSYLICNSGINNTNDGTSPSPTVYSIVDNSNYPGNTYTDTWGFIKISPDGSHLADATSRSVNVFDFNNQTGAALFNNQVYTLSSNNETPGWGVEFSPNSQFLYFSLANTILQGKMSDSGAARMDTVYIYQRDVTTKNSENHIIGKFPVASIYKNSLVPITSTRGYSLQRAIDNKIYVCVDNTDINMGGSNEWLGAVVQPDLAYPNCNFNQYQIRLAPGTRHLCYLPQWVWKATVTPNSICIAGVWPKVYIAADGLLWLKQTTGNSLITSANIINMPTNINHVGDINSSSQEIFNWVHYGMQTAYTKWTNTASTPYPPFSLSTGELQYCHYPSAPFYINEQNGNNVSGPAAYLPSNCGQIVVEDNGVYVAYEGDRLRIYTSLISRYIMLPFSTSGYTDIQTKAYFNPVSKLVFFIFKGYSSFGPDPTYLVIYSLSNGRLIPLYNTYYDLSAYEVLGVNTADELFVLNTGVLQEFDYTTNTLATLSIPNFNNQSLIPLRTDGQVVNDNLLLKKQSDYNIYAINTLSLSGKSCYNSSMGAAYPIWSGIYNYSFASNGQNVFVTGIFNTNNYTIASQTMPNISAGIHYQQSTFVTKLDLTSDFTALRPGLMNETNTERYVQKGVAEMNDKNELKTGFIITQNPVKEILGINITGFNKITSPVSGYITNAEGKKVLTIPVLKENNTLNVSLLRAGIYYISLFSKENLVATKVFLKE